jgi:hypothetical protein
MVVLLLFSSVMTVSVSVLSRSRRSWSRSTAASRSLRSGTVPRIKIIEGFKQFPRRKVDKYRNRYLK